MKNGKNMTVGRPGRLILTFAVPLIIGNLGQQFYMIVDSIIVGQGVGVKGLAAVGATDWTYWLFLWTIQALTQGFSIPVAQRYGMGNSSEVKKAISMSIFLCGVLGLALTALGLSSIFPLLHILKTPGDIYDGASSYLRVMFGGLLAVMAYNMASAILRAFGDGRTPLIAMAIAAVTNIALDLLFVLGFGLGIAGAAAATLIAQLVSSLFCLYHIRKIEILNLQPSDFSLRDKNLSLRLLTLGFPMAFQNAIISIGGMIVQSVVNGFGVIFIAGFTATNKLYGVLEVAATSYGYSMVTYTGQNLGAGQTDRIRRGVRSALLIALATSLVIALLMIFGGKMILGCFISGTPEEFEQTLAIAYYYLAIMSLCLPILYTLHITRSAIQGMGNTILPLVSGIAEFLMRALTAIFLPMVIGENGIFYAEIMAWTGATVILVISYFAVIRRMERLLKR